MRNHTALLTSAADLVSVPVRAGVAGGGDSTSDIDVDRRSPMNESSAGSTKNPREDDDSVILNRSQKKKSRISEATSVSGEPNIAPGRMDAQEFSSWSDFGQYISRSERKVAAVSAQKDTKNGAVIGLCVNAADPCLGAWVLADIVRAATRSETKKGWTHRVSTAPGVEVLVALTAANYFQADAPTPPSSAMRPPVWVSF